LKKKKKYARVGYLSTRISKKQREREIREEKAGRESKNKDNKGHASVRSSLGQTLTSNPASLKDQSQNAKISVEGKKEKRNST